MEYLPLESTRLVNTEEFDTSSISSINSDSLNSGESSEEEQKIQGQIREELRVSIMKRSVSEKSMRDHVAQDQPPPEMEKESDDSGGSSDSKGSRESS